MKIGFHSPLPPARTGVAEYSFALKKALETTDTIEVNSSNADIDLYHIGNNQLHAAIYQKALSKPGVVVLHDAVLQHFFCRRAILAGINPVQPVPQHTKRRHINF